jgi:hypothetical protein
MVDISKKCRLDAIIFFFFLPSSMGWFGSFSGQFGGFIQRGLLVATHVLVFH